MSKNKLIFISILLFTFTKSALKLKIKKNKFKLLKCISFIFVIKFTI